jgi:hypothetical protein
MTLSQASHAGWGGPPARDELSARVKLLAVEPFIVSADVKNARAVGVYRQRRPR